MSSLLHLFLSTNFQPINLIFIKGVVIVIGKLLTLSPAFPPLHTVQASFPAYGVPTNPISMYMGDGEEVCLFFISLAILEI
jgi:hypothetical protein